MLCATLPNVTVVALTATASKSDMAAIKQSLNLKRTIEVIANQNQGEDIDFFETLLKPIAEQLKEKTVNYPFNCVVSTT